MNQFLERVAGISNGRALLIGLILGAAYYFGAYDDGSALEAQIKVVSQKLTEAEAKKKETEAVLKEEARMKETLGRLSEQYAFIAKKLPSELKSSDMIRSIDTVAKMSGVSIKMKKPGVVEKKEVVEALPVDVVFEGSYAQVATFIYHISNQERLTRFMNFSVSNQDEHKPLKVEGQVMSYKLAPEEVKDTKADGTGTPGAAQEPAR